MGPLRLPPSEYRAPQLLQCLRPFRLAIEVSSSIRKRSSVCGGSFGLGFADRQVDDGPELRIKGELGGSDMQALVASLFLAALVMGLEISGRTE